MKIKKKCIYCGNSFTAQTLITKYCSPTCNKRHYKIRLKKGEIEIASFKENSLATNLYERQTLLNMKYYLSINETMELIGISRSTIYRLIKTNKIDVTKIGKRVLIAKSELEDLLNSSTKTFIPDSVHDIKQNFNIQNYYYIGEVQNKYGISEKQLHTLLIKHSIEKVTIGRQVYVLKSDIKNILT